MEVLTAQIRTGEFTGLVASDKKLSPEELQKKYENYGDDVVQDDEFRRCLEEQGIKRFHRPNLD